MLLEAGGVDNQARRILSPRTEAIIDPPGPTAFGPPVGLLLDLAGGALEAGALELAEERATEVIAIARAVLADQDDGGPG